MAICKPQETKARKKASGHQESDYTRNGNCPEDTWSHICIPLHSKPTSSAYPPNVPLDRRCALLPFEYSFSNPLSLNKFNFSSLTIWGGYLAHPCAPSTMFTFQIQHPRWWPMKPLKTSRANVNRRHLNLSVINGQDCRKCRRDLSIVSRAWGREIRWYLVSGMPRGKTGQCLGIKMKVHSTTQEETWNSMAFHDNYIARATFKPICQTIYMRPDWFQLGTAPWKHLHPFPFFSFLAVDIFKINKLDTISYVNLQLAIPIFLKSDKAKPTHWPLVLILTYKYANYFH